ncbi:hypothetical protein Aple_015940 [Acrocarpospora pleiomorpha]|uniref:Uncharacterized protein n=1 Tax=Acrocarpospora pleiomorpha TaxID=90975 RepID=A0A5M3XEY1_9ACTN|nr:hypothetical protein Aple_015940 [Acrocarpospora pleiomorpha]
MTCLPAGLGWCTLLAGSWGSASVSDWLSDPVCSTESVPGDMPGTHQSSSCPGADGPSHGPCEHVPPDADRSDVHGLTGEGTRRRLGAGCACDTMPHDHYGSLIEWESLVGDE